MSGLLHDSNGNGWDACGKLVDPWFEDEAETVRYTHETALKAQSEADREAFEEWSHDQGQELAPAFEHVPCVPCVSLASFSMAKAA